MEYNFYLDNHQGVPKTVPTKPDFSLDFDAIEKAIHANTRAVLINSPNNPTGKVYSRQDLDTLGDLLKTFSRKLGQPIYLISDEPYRKIVYDGLSVPSVFASYPETFLVTSFSKDLSLPVERIGYAAVNPNMSDKKTVMNGMILCNRVLGYVNAPSIMQRVVADLLEETPPKAADLHGKQEAKIAVNKDFCMFCGACVYACPGEDIIVLKRNGIRIKGKETDLFHKLKEKLFTKRTSKVKEEVTPGQVSVKVLEKA